MCVYVYDLVGMSEDTLLKLDPTSNEHHSNEVLEGFKVVKTSACVYVDVCVWQTFMLQCKRMRLQNEN